jgi:hypothetical protein
MVSGGLDGTGGAGRENGTEMPLRVESRPEIQHSGAGVYHSATNCDDTLILKQPIPQELQYSAIYWLDHLEDHLSKSPVGGSNDEDSKLTEAIGHSGKILKGVSG